MERRVEERRQLRQDACLAERRGAGLRDVAAGPMKGAAACREPVHRLAAQNVLTDAMARMWFHRAVPRGASELARRARTKQEDAAQKFELAEQREPQAKLVASLQGLPVQRERPDEQQRVAQREQAQTREVVAQPDAR